MPRLPIDYSKTIIYKICCKDVSIKDIYIGHTTDLTRRRRQHKSSCNNETEKEHNAYKYQFIRNNGDWKNWSVIPIEEFPCENINEARIRERYWIEELKATLNKEIPLRTYKEWRDDNHKKILEKQKEYRENNRKILNEKAKEYRENNLDKIKEYRGDNKEKISKKAKEYYENNKEKINEKFTCECGGCYTYHHKSYHLKTKKHQDYLTQTISA